MAVAVCDRLDQVHAFVSAQEKAGLGDKFVDSLRTSQINAVKSFLSSCKIDLVGATSIIEKVNKGPWTAEAKLSIIEVVNDRVAPMSKIAATQSCLTLSAYLTNTEWDSLASKSSRVQKIRVVVDRMALIGLFNPSEQTRKDAACTAGLFLQDIAGKDLCDDVRFWLNRKDKVRVGEVLANYPSHPKLLEKRLYDHAYANEVPAEAGYVDTSRWSEVSTQLALRKTNRMCHSGSPTSSQSSSSVWSPPRVDTSQQLMTLFSMLLSNQQMQQPQPLLTLLQPTPERALVLPQPRLETPVAPSSSTATQSCNAAKPDLGDMYACMVWVLQI